MVSDPTTMALTPESLDAVEKEARERVEEYIRCLHGAEGGHSDHSEGLTALTNYGTLRQTRGAWEVYTTHSVTGVTSAKNEPRFNYGIHRPRRGRCNQPLGDQCACFRPGGHDGFHTCASHRESRELMIRVTAEDLATGEKEWVDFDNDYVLTVAGNTYLASTQTYRNGTHVLTIKREPKAEKAGTE